MNRKEFIKLASASVVITSLGISLTSCESDDQESPTLSGPVEVDLAVSPYSELVTDGEWLLHPSLNILLVNDNGDIRAFTSVCTHTGCARNWSFSNEEFLCSCHNSKFDINGNVVSGPASGSLTEFNVARSGDLLTLT